MALLVEDRAVGEGVSIRTLTLSRPERRHALDTAHLLLLAKALEAVDSTPELRCVLITGAGDAFCSGFDLGTEFPPSEGAPDSLVAETMAAVRACRIPVVARIRGPAYGAGLELALSCDLRFSDDSASFCLPPAKLGIAYAPGGLARLVSLVGTAKARWMALGSPVVDAQTALRWGLVDERCEEEALDARVGAVCEALAARAPLAVQAMKRTLNALEASLSPEEREEAEAARMRCYQSEDTREGRQAFLEKRLPRFFGR